MARFTRRIAFALVWVLLPLQLWAAQRSPRRFIEKARDQLIDRGYSPGAASDHVTPEMQRALMLFQQELGIPTTGRLDAATLGALGVTHPISSEFSGYEKPLSSESRKDLRAAAQDLHSAETAAASKKTNEVVHHLEETQHLLALDNYHAGRVRVMRAKYEAEMAEMFAEKQRFGDAKDSIHHAEKEISDELSGRPETTLSQQREPRNPRAETARQPYWGDLHGTPEGSEIRAHLNEEKNEQAGEAPKPEQTCASPPCDSTTESGEWMKGAADAGSPEH